MAEMICSKCMEVFLAAEDKRCKTCGDDCYDFTNDDAFLLREAARVKQERKAAGLDGMVGGLAGVIINVEPDHQQATVQEFLDLTGHLYTYGFEDDGARTLVLTSEGSADLLIQCRKGESPFESVDAYPKARYLPHTRLETFIFHTPDIRAYAEAQRDRGVAFMTDDVLEGDHCVFIQTIPSSYTGISIGLIEWKGNKKGYRTRDAVDLDWKFEKPRFPHLRNIGRLDHAATRLEARDRDPAIIEFMNLTNYNFDFSIYVRRFNSITNVARLSLDDFAMVFTSGVHPFVDEEHSGPTEKFVHNYGKRVHHLAFHTEHIEETFRALGEHGMEFLVELVGNEEEGLRQTFSMPSPHTLIVNEYIHRYGDFDGFFTLSNVTKLTQATDKQ